jgi:WD40 repeat protein
MRMQRTIVLCGLIAASLLAVGASAPAPGGPHVDGANDPWPSSAVTQLGSRCFRLESEKRMTISLRANIAVGPSASGLELCVYDLTSGNLIRHIPTNGRRKARQAYLDPDGRIVYVEGENAGLARYDVRTSAFLGEWPVQLGETRIRRELSFSADGTRVALFEGGQGDYMASVWEPATGRIIASLKFTATESPRVVLSADGLLLAVSQDTRFVFDQTNVTEAQRTVLLWDVKADKELRRIQVQSPVVNLALSPDGHRLAVAERDTHLSIWDTESGKMLHRQKVPDGTGDALLFSPDGRRLAAATYSYSHRNSVLLWKADLTKSIEVHSPPVDRCLQVFFQDDGTLLATGNGWDEHHLRLWEPESGRQRAAGDGHGSEVCSLVYTRDGKTLFSTTFDEFRTWGTTKGTCLRHLPLPPQSRFYLPYGVVSPDGAYILNADLGKRRVQMISTATEKEIGFLRKIELQEHHPVALSSTGRCIGSDGSRVSVWDLQTCRELLTLDVPGADWGCLALTPNGQSFALTTRLPVDTAQTPNGGFQWVVYSYELSFWSVKGKRKWKVPLGLMEPGRLVFSPDGSLLAVWAKGAEANELRVLETATDREVRSLRLAPDNDELAFAPSNHHDLFAFSPDGRVLAVVEGKQDESCPAVVALWEVASGQKRGEFSVARARVTALAFSPNGRQLATGLRDGTILLWDTTGRADAGSLAAIPPTKEEFPELWAVLGGDDAVAAHRAIQRLAAHPKAAAEFARRYLSPVKEKPPSTQAIQHWITDLDDDAYARREEASRQLTAFGKAVDAEITKALKRPSSPETHRRLEESREKMRSRLLQPEQVRLTRALEILERAGTAEPRQLLEQLARGQGYAWLTREANAVLKRLDTR